jgi:hypothetical protein
MHTAPDRALASGGWRASSQFTAGLTLRLTGARPSVEGRDLAIQRLEVVERLTRLAYSSLKPTLRVTWK